RAVCPQRSIRLPGLALDLERRASGARAGRVHRSLQRLAASSQLGLGTAEWSDVSGAVDGDGADNAEASRPSWRTLARVPARGVTESNKRTLHAFLLSEGRDGWRRGAPFPVDAPRPWRGRCCAARRRRPLPDRSAVRDRRRLALCANAVESNGQRRVRAQRRSPATAGAACNGENSRTKLLDVHADSWAKCRMSLGTAPLVVGIEIKLVWMRAQPNRIELLLALVSSPGVD